MGVCNAVGHLAGQLQRIRPADQQVAGVEAEPNRRTVQHSLDLAAGLHHRADVRVQHGQHAAIGGGIGEPVQIAQQRRPLPVIERRSCVVSVGAGGRGQHEHICFTCHQCVERGGDIGQRVVVGVVQNHRGELADTAEVERVKQRCQLRRVRRQKALGPQLCGGQPDVAHLGEHPLR